MIIFMLRRKTKPKIKVTLSVFSILLMIIFGFLIFYLSKTFTFLSGLDDINYKTENYLVLVMNDSNYNTISDLGNKSIGYVNNEVSHIDKALEMLDEMVLVEKSSLNNYDVLVRRLYNLELDSIIIEESYREIIAEDFKDFHDKTRVLHRIEVKVENIDVVKNVDVKSDAFNIYISGIDTYGNISSVSRSDVNIIASINPTTHQILLTTIPRDFYVQLDGTTGYKDKLTHAGVYGVDKSIKTIENLLDIEINYYIKVNFSSVEKLVDTLGGVDVYSEYTFIGDGGTNYIRGYNKVNGKQALEFVRTRKTVDGGDRTRGKNQQALISAMVNKACSPDIITRYTNILSSLEGSFQTNMPTDKITDFLKKQIDEMKPWNITSISLDGVGSSEYTYSYSHQLLYVMVPDMNTIINAKEKINQLRDNQILDGSYIENNGVVNIPTKVEPPKEEEKVDIETPSVSDEVEVPDVEVKLPLEEESQDDVKLPDDVEVPPTLDDVPSSEPTVDAVVPPTLDDVPSSEPSVDVEVPSSEPSVDVEVPSTTDQSNDNISDSGNVDQNVESDL